MLKSTGERKCLTKCNPMQTPFIHPITLEIIQGRSTNICAVNPEYQYNAPLSKDGSGYNRLIYDQCNLDDNSKKTLPNILESLLLQNTFDTLEFLNKIYDLYSFDDIIKWTVSHDDIPFNTVKRIHNCGWQIYVSNNNQPNKNLTIKVYDYYYNMFQNKWIKDGILQIQKDRLFLVLEKTDIATVVRKYINLENTTEWINLFIYSNLNDWINLGDYYTKIKQFCIDCLVKKIKQDYK